MSRESAAAFKMPQNDEVPEFKELPANDNFELQNTANDNFELAHPETPLEIDDDRIDEVKERLGLHKVEVPDIETFSSDEGAENAVPNAAEAGGIPPQGPEGPEDGGDDNNEKKPSGTDGGSGGGGPTQNKVEQVKKALNPHGHAKVDWMNTWYGKWFAIYPLAYIIFPIWDFIKNTKFSSVVDDLMKGFGIKGGGGGGGGSHGGGSHGGDHGGGGGHH